FIHSDTASFYTFILSLHDALPISFATGLKEGDNVIGAYRPTRAGLIKDVTSSDYGKFIVRGVASVIENWHVPGMQSDLHGRNDRSEEHTSELQSRENLVCRLLLEK